MRIVIEVPGYIACEIGQLAFSTDDVEAVVKFLEEQIVELRKWMDR